MTIYRFDMKNLLVSFSGGETSGFMAQGLKINHAELGFNKVCFVFANTGQENEETLVFTDQCDKAFDLGLVWVEAKVNQEKGKGTRHKIVDFESASRNGKPFEDIIKKYGIPNHASPGCTRDLKQYPIDSFAKDFFAGEKYATAIGIRSDEVDRVSPKRKNRSLIYPLITNVPMSKQKINFWWHNQAFRLKLKGYQGNCKTCWKKSDKKLYQLAIENPLQFEFMDKMEQEYGRVGNEFDRDPLAKNRTFFRSHRSAKDILSESKDFHGFVKDDTQDINDQLRMFENESCEIFSNCGDK